LEENLEYGKSTLILQICDKINTDQTVLYISGEESAEQIKLRADRLKINKNNIMFYGETDIDLIESEIEKENPKLVIIDSIQTVFSDKVDSIPGSTSQLREITSRIMRMCKEKGVTTIIIGHVTKDRKHSRTKSARAYGRCCTVFRGREILYI